MSKIKFNKEWYNNNKVVIHCKTEDESILLTRELHKMDIDVNWDMFSVYYRYKNKTCYGCKSNWINYANIGYYIDKDYTIINFSDLEFESEYELDTQNKKIILKENVKLNNGDIVSIRQYNSDCDKYIYGIIANNNILYNDGGFDTIDSIQEVIDEDLLWYIKGEDTVLLGGEINKLLFKGELKDKLKDLIIYVQNKPKEIRTKIYEVKFNNSSSMGYKFISDCDSIEIGDTVCPIGGGFSDRYGIVENIEEVNIEEEELKSYNKVIKIK